MICTDLLFKSTKIDLVHVEETQEEYVVNINDHALGTCDTSCEYNTVNNISQTMDVHMCGIIAFTITIDYADIVYLKDITH